MASGIDLIINGQPFGAVAEGMRDVGYNEGMRRPYFDDQGNGVVSLKTGRMTYNAEKKMMLPEYQVVRIADLIGRGRMHSVFNATSLRRDDWKFIDRTVIRAARKRLRAWTDLVNASSTGGFNAYAKSIYEYTTMSDPGEAVVDMDGMTEGRNDSTKFQEEGIPLPITHSDFWFSRRRLEISRNSNTPLDTVMIEAAGRRVGEMIEKTLIGTVTGMTYGTSSTYSRTSKVYGYTNFTPRITKTNMTAPTGSNGSAVLTSWLALRELLYAANHFGPFMVYTSTDWDQYLDNLFSTTEPSAGTLRSRLLQIDGIQGIRRLDYLTNTFTVLMISMTPEVATAINGMDITTVQWESVGGERLNFKVMAIQVPLLRCDFAGNCGIAHGTTS